MKSLLVLVMLAGVAAAEPTPPELKQSCLAAMNADPEFEQAILHGADKRIDQKTIDAHNDALYHVQKDERHVIIAYVAMWLIAAGFVVFLWRRQQGLVAQIDQLRRDLDAAAKEAK